MGFLRRVPLAAVLLATSLVPSGCSRCTDDVGCLTSLVVDVNQDLAPDTTIEVCVEGNCAQVTGVPGYSSSPAGVINSVTRGGAFVPNDELTPGPHEVQVNITAADGQSVASFDGSVDFDPDACIPGCLHGRVKLEID
jgi:hypothetical protein